MRLILGDGDLRSNLIQLLFLIPVMMIALTLHELAHGYTAYKLGDPTARNFGRLTLNPIKHLDPVGVLMILFVGFGWAKPVPVDPRYFKNPKRDIALTAIAGPVTNLICAFAGILIFRVIWTFIPQSIFVYFILVFFNTFISLNLFLALFNLIPMPPLDGSKIFDSVLPPSASYQYQRFQRYGFLILIFLMFTIGFRWLNVPVNAIYRFFNWIIDFIPFL